MNGQYGRLRAEYTTWMPQAVFTTAPCDSHPCITGVEVRYKGIKQTAAQRGRASAEVQNKRACHRTGLQTQAPGPKLPEAHVQNSIEGSEGFLPILTRLFIFTFPNVPCMGWGVLW